MVTTVEFGQVVQSLQDQLHEQQLQIAYLRGEQLGTLRKNTFQIPGAHLSDAEKRYMNRVLQAAEPHMQRIWELTDGANDSNRGMTSFWVHHLQASIRGSGVHEYRRWLDGPQAVHEFMQFRHARNQVEKERKLVKLFRPTTYIGRQRRKGGTQQALNGYRIFMSGQCYSNETLLGTTKGLRRWAQEWMPCSWRFTKPELVDEANCDRRAQLDAARLARAEMAFAEVVEHKGRRACFLVEVLKKPKCEIKLLPYLMRHLIEVADADEFHLIVKIEDDEGNAWTRTLAAQWMYTELGFRDPKKMDPDYEYLPTAQPKSNQRYLVVPKRVLECRVRDLLMPRFATSTTR